MNGSRARILLIADVPNWIFARHCRVLVERLSDEFDFSVLHANEPFAEEAFDLIYPLEWNLVAPERITCPGKYVTGIRSHISWSNHDFDEFTSYLRTAFHRVHVVSRRLHRLLSPFVPGLLHLSHGVDTRFFAPGLAPGAPPAGRSRLRIGWAGNRAAPGKGVGELLAPLAHVPGVQLVTCGYGHRHLTMDEMRDFYGTLDIYACASLQEGHNNSLLEAAAMQLAIVTTDNGTVPEYLRDGVSALIVDREYRAILAAVHDLFDAPERRRQLGEAARRAVVEHFEWDRVIVGYRELFRSALLAGPGASAPARLLKAPAPAAAPVLDPLVARAVAAEAAEARLRDEMRRASLLIETARSLVPSVVSRRIEEITVYGAGAAGCALAEALAWHGVRVVHFVDSDPAKIGARLYGVEVVSLQDAVRRGVDRFVIGSFAFADEIRQAIETAYVLAGRRPLILGPETPCSRRN